MNNALAIWEKYISSECRKSEEQEVEVAETDIVAPRDLA
jgi:hypothetical protein